MKPWSAPAGKVPTRLLVAVLGAAIVLCGCGSTTTTAGPTALAGQTAPSAPATAEASAVTGPAGATPGPGTPEACALLTKAQVSAALGVAVSDGKQVVSTSTLLCGWAEATAAPGTGRRVTVTISTERAFALGLTPISGITKTPVSDIGDEAYYVTASGLGTTLNVRKGTSAFAVAALTDGALSLDQTMEAEKALALEVLGRL